MRYKLGILGVGKMGGSILKGILSSNLMKQEDILLCFHSEEKKEIAKQEGYQATCKAKDIFANCEMILLAIKPQCFEETLTEAKSFDFSQQGILSIAAGISISWLKDYFKSGTIIRAMPNTPALIGCGVTTICFEKESGFSKLAYDIFSSIGTCFVIKENQMDSSLPLNGSMPAYLYDFAKQFIDNAVSLGIEENLARKLVAESIISSAKMILSQDVSINTLIQNVCSKGGTTIAGLNQLDERFNDSIKDCYQACVNRSKELNK